MRWTEFARRIRQTVQAVTDMPGLTSAQICAIIGDYPASVHGRLRRLEAGGAIVAVRRGSAVLWWPAGYVPCPHCRGEGMVGGHDAE